MKAGLSEIKNHLSEYIKRSKKDDLVITVYGKSVPVLVGFEVEDENDLLDYQLLNDEELKRKDSEIARAIQARRVSDY